MKNDFNSKLNLEGVLHTRSIVQSINGQNMPKITFSEKARETLSKGKVDIIGEQSQSKPRATKSIGKANQKRGNGRSCM